MLFAANIRNVVFNDSAIIAFIQLQQKVKEAAIIDTADISLAGLNEKPKHEISDNQNAKLVTSNFVSTESTKAKKFNKAKRTPPILLKKQETKTVPSER